MIKLPCKENAPPLGNSRYQAIRHLLSNEKALKAKCRLVEFHTVLREYLSLGHAEVIPHPEVDVRPHFYVPVHAVQEVEGHL